MIRCSSKNVSFSFDRVHFQSLVPRLSSKSAKYVVMLSQAKFLKSSDMLNSDENFFSEPSNVLRFRNFMSDDCQL